MMKEHGRPKAKEIFIAAALILFLIPGLCAVYSGVHRIFERSRDPELRYREISFAEEYPFRSTDADLPAAGESTFVKKYLAAASVLTDSVGSYSGRKNIVSPFFLYLYGRITDALGKEVIDDAEKPVVRLKNGYLAYTYPYSEESAEYADISVFDKWLAEKNIPFLFIMPADKTDSRYAVYPRGFPEGYADAENEYSEYLDGSGIPYLNSAELLVSENGDFYSWFYKTDHHWNVRAGFSVASAIARRLETEFGLPVDADILNSEHFQTVAYENLFLGSQGKKVTHGYISPENFEVIYPLFDTEFSIELPSMSLARTDTFENTLLNSRGLKTGNYYANNAYTSFLYGDFPLTRIHNMNCNNGIRALMIKNSDADVVNPYLAFTVEYLDIIDPRHFDGSMITFIGTTHPDVVLMCVYPSEIPEQAMRDIEQAFRG